MQGAYIFLTAVWPLVDIKSFMLITGPKTDIWLVKTVAAMLLPVALSFFVASHQQQINWPVYLLAMGSCIAFASIDFYYTLNGTIKWVYQLDGYLQIIFFITWIILILRLRFKV